LESFDMADTVVVTGATGFLAGHCVRELLAHGYAVRATVRDPREADVAHLRAIAEDTGGSLDFVGATLDADAGWAEAVAGCAYVMHVASPFPLLLPAKEDDVIRPAVDGTLRVLRAARDSGTVRRVVLTSSLAAMVAGHTASRTFSETDWADLNRAGAYQKSKALAERAAWDFAAESGIELVALLPGQILGPLLRAARPTSMEAIRGLLAGEIPAVPRIGWAPVDVRDLARVHRLALESPVAAGNRYAVAGPHVWMRDTATMLAGAFGPRDYRVATRRMPRWLMWTMARFDPGLRLPLSYFGRTEDIDASRAANDLGWTARPVRESVLAAAESMIRLGVVPARNRRPAVSREADAATRGHPAGCITGAA
jgi:dihydroflavonol-4-reductase